MRNKTKRKDNELTLSVISALAENNKATQMIATKGDPWE